MGGCSVPPLLVVWVRVPWVPRVGRKEAVGTGSAGADGLPAG